MRIGFDVDGVLANFTSAYQDLFIKTTGRNLFAAGDRVDPPTWDWPTLRGYTDAETAAVWDVINTSETFWLNLADAPGMSTLHTMIRHLENKHEVYFITQRTGISPKRQTEIWLVQQLHYPIYSLPTVLIVGKHMKGTVVRALQLDAYVDDNLDNVIDCCMMSPTTRTYLLDRGYNRDDTNWRALRAQLLARKSPSLTTRVEDFTRVATVGEMFDAEIQLGL